MPTDSLPPAQPAYILRGHAAHVHALHFTRGNSRLLTGDADGCIISWSLAFKRPVAVWKAHESAILGLASWGEDCIITHGRDNKLMVWQLTAADESDMAKTLPANGSLISVKQPWLLHSLFVNTLNFCSFAMTYQALPKPCPGHLVVDDSNTKSRPILVAVPNTLDSGGIDIYHLPSEIRATTIDGDKSTKTGMVMALGILAKGTSLQVTAGYESGHTMLFVQDSPGKKWQKLYSAQSHTQPVLSLDISPSQDYFVTSSADATIAKHPLYARDTAIDVYSKPIKISKTRHSGQQGLRIRSDGKIFATAGWDTRIRVYSARNLKELAVLGWHKDGCYATAFAEVGSIRLDIDEQVQPVQEPDAGSDLAIASQSSTQSLVQQRRDEKAQSTHWLAAGSKDGKVSLWDIY